MLRSCGLYQTRGSNPIRAAECRRAPGARDRGQQLRAGLLHDRRGVADHGRRRVGVVAVDDHLHPHRHPTRQVAAVTVGDDERGPGVVGVDQTVELGVAVDGPGVVEVAGVDEGRDQRPALGRAVAVVHGQADVADVEVEGVAVEQQEERRDEEQDEQRAAIARDLPDLLDHHSADDGDHAACPPRSTTSRNTSSSDGVT